MISSCVTRFNKLCLRPSTINVFTNRLPNVTNKSTGNGTELDYMVPITTTTTIISRQFHVAQQNLAARKGTREKARKNKVKVEVKKVGFIPHNQRGKDKLNLLLKNKHIDDSWKQIPKDDVYPGRYYRWYVYSVAEAIACHRETNHPTMYGHPNAPLNVQIELNMQGEKITRFVDNFQRMAMIKHSFEHGEDREIMVLTKGEDNLKLATDAGASIVGGSDLIKNIQSGDIKVSDYQFVIAHPNIMPELVTIRGLMKRKFPNPKSGTLGVNLVELIKQHLNGVQYGAKKDEYQQNYGIIRTCIGRLNMDAKHLEENLEALLIDVNSVRPRREGRFITRVILKSPPSRELLKIDPFVYVPEENAPKGTTSKGTSAATEVDDQDNDEDEQTGENVEKISISN